MATNNLPDPIVTNPINNVIVNIDAPDTTINLSNYFDDPLTTGKVAHFNLANTSGGTIGNGTINVVLFNQTGIGAPLTVQNFQSYVTAGSYTNSFIHRSVPGFIVQGGGYTYNNSKLAQIPANPAVQNEFSTNRSNLRGTIAMAKLGSDPNSATNQWFFNLADNSTNLDNQNGGFTVFGQAIATNDLTTIDAIANVPIYNAGTVFTNLPLTKAAISDTNFIRFSSITVTQEDELKFSIVGNSQPTLVTPKITNQQLVLDYLPNQIGNSDITIRATNLFGEFIDYKFTATVLPTITLSSSNISENQPINTVIGNLITTNTGNTFTYSLVTGTGATDNTLFTITGNQLKTNAVFDFETKNSYTVRVRTTDQGGFFFDKQFTININNLDNIITGTIANENFSTTGEKDTINAQGGNDTITSSFENLQPNDSLNGGTGNDTLIITGGTATDAISISVNNTNNQLNIVGTTIINFEQFDLSGFGGKTNFLGAATNDWIKAGIGNDILNGGAGADTMIGGAGNDSYYVNNVGDSIIENANEGTDTVFTTITYTLAANVENLTLQGTTAINGIGNDLNNTITGNTVANTLNGGAGADTLIGGVGNDNLSLGLNDNAIDNVNYVLGGGVDTVTQFIRGIGGDKLNFSGITNLDVKTSGTSTQIRVGDGIGGNAGFGTGMLLVTLSGITGFVAGDVNVNLFRGNFSFT